MSIRTTFSKKKISEFEKIVRIIATFSIEKLAESEKHSLQILRISLGSLKLSAFKQLFL